MQQNLLTSVSGPGIAHAVSNISSRSYIMIPIVLYSGNTMRSIPGRPILVPFTMSHILRTFARTSSFVCRRGMGYWKTHTSTLSGELEMSPGLDMMMVGE